MRTSQSGSPIILSCLVTRKVHDLPVTDMNNKLISTNTFGADRPCAPPNLVHTFSLQ